MGWFSKGYRRVNGQWVSDELIRTNYYQIMSGTPQQKLQALPICRDCPSEVKPGEDLCWNCLHETQEPEAYIFNYTATVSAVVTKATFSTPAGYTWKTFSPIHLANGDTLQLTWKPDVSTPLSEYPISLTSVT